MVEGVESRLSKTLEALKNNDLQSKKNDDLSELVHQVQHLSSLIENMPAENRTLRRLFFPSIFRRENDVTDAAGKTLTWIFDEDPEAAMNLQSTSEQEADEAALRRDTSQSFIQFLRGDGRTFFVTGKAGCGKSTFMKYVAHHVKTEENLQPWTEGAKLVMAKLFFWQSDDVFQSSIEGFWRSILFQLLSQCPELIPGVFPQKQPSGAEATTDAVEFRASELEAAFARLMQLADPGVYRFVFFIDGLDEHEGDNDTHARLANLLVSRAALANVKVVCSSRPHTVFLDVFRAGITVHFHELTRSDIASFAKSRFEASLTGDQVLTAQRNCVALVDDITTRAQGVFLWAGIVVRALINQALDHDGEEKSLRQRLDECPDDLPALFQQMLSSVDSASHVRKRSNVALYLAVHNPFESPLNMLVYSWLQGLDWCQNAETLQDANPKDIVQTQYMEANVASCRKKVEVLLHQITRGLLEVVSTGDPIPFFKYRVDMYHRSARDFLKDQWGHGALEKPFPGAFEEVEVFCRLRSLEVKAIAMQSDHLQVGAINHEDNTLLDNLRTIFDYTFFWLAACSKKGNHASTSSLGQFESALDAAENKLGPFLLGQLLINEEISWRYHSRSAHHKCSFLHLAAYFGQEKFVKRHGGPMVSSKAPGSSSLSLLLNSSLAADVHTTKYLFANKHGPDDMIFISDHQPGKNDSLVEAPVEAHGGNGAAVTHATWQNIQDIGGGTTDRQDSSGGHLTLMAIWMVFLRDLSNNVRVYLWKRAVSSSYPYHLDRGWLERLADIVEAYLEAGADPSVYFVLLLGDVAHRVDLDQMLDIFQPENLASVAEMLLASKRRRSWRRVVGDVVAGLLWQSQVAPRVEYASATTTDLRNHEWRVVGVRSERGGELMGSFKVRVF